jgi:Lysine methyltransferase
MLTAGSVVQSLNSHSAIQTLGNPDLATSDLVPGRYEGVTRANASVSLGGKCRLPSQVPPPYGQKLVLPAAGGLKLWESAVDLANFLLDGFCSPIAGQERRLEGMHGLRVIELGCGHGLPGIVCALAGAEVCFQVRAGGCAELTSVMCRPCKCCSAVGWHNNPAHIAAGCAQDYNSEALTELTAPNLHMNATMHQVTVRLISAWSARLQRGLGAAKMWTHLICLPDACRLHWHQRASLRVPGGRLGSCSRLWVWPSRLIWSCRLRLYTAQSLWRRCLNASSRQVVCTS